MKITIGDLVTDAVTKLNESADTDEEFEELLQELVVGLLMFEDTTSVLVIDVFDEDDLDEEDLEFSRWWDDLDYDDDDDEDDYPFGNFPASLDREIL